MRCTLLIVLFAANLLIPLKVSAQSCLGSVSETDPKSGHIDPRQDRVGRTTRADGPRQLRYTFDDASTVGRSCFSISSTDAVGPSIAGVSVQGNNVTLTLDRPISANKFTTIIYTFYSGAARTLVNLGLLWGDVDGSGCVSGTDFVHFTGCMNGSIECNPLHIDMDRNGKVDKLDITRMLEALKVNRGRCMENYTPPAPESTTPECRDLTSYRSKLQKRLVDHIKRMTKLEVKITRYAVLRDKIALQIQELQNTGSATPELLAKIEGLQGKIEKLDERIQSYSTQLTSAQSLLGYSVNRIAQLEQDIAATC